MIIIIFFFLQKIMSWKESAVLELKHLESSLSVQKNEIENGVENLEGKNSFKYYYSASSYCSGLVKCWGTLPRVRSWC